MKILKYISVAVMAVVSAVSVTACSLNKNNEDSSEPVTTAETPTEIVTEPVTEETTEPVNAVEEIPVSYPEMEHSYAGDLYEAERERLSDGLTPTNEREGYSGGGYVTGFGTSGKTSLKFRFDAPATQHYDLSFGVAADSNVKCRVIMNGSELFSFYTSSDGYFQKITYYGAFLEKGHTTVEIIPEGEIMLDYLDVENSYSVNQISYETDGKSVNTHISTEAGNLLKFLSDNYGKYTLTGQYVSGADNSEMEIIREITGQYPVIRFSTVSDPKNTDNVDACVQWHENGGINGITWEWKSPSMVSSVYTSECDFSIWNAMTDADIATLSTQEIEDLYNKGMISDDCYNLIKAMDEFAENQLLPLKQKGVPVLWRPLYDASLGYETVEGAEYWWGAGGTATYQWLWNLMYNRYTDYFSLDNLIWVWNGMSDVYSVDPSTFDIATYDLYTDTENFGSRSEQLMASQKYINNKIIGISECDNLPDIDAMFRDNSVWSFFGMWNGDYITDANGTYSEKYNTRDELIKAYNSEGSLNLDEYRTLTGGGELPAGKRNFSEELQKEYQETTEPETEPQTVDYGYIEDDNNYVQDDYSYDYNDYGYDYGYDDYSYDYGYDDYGYDYGYSEW
ncbi:MAG: glycoside hydrolase [Ruminococcus sp.]|nr:glycoside hydrolase [Ruminococcus sp.]